MPRFTPLAFLVAIFVSTLSAQENEVDPYEWTTETYQFPSHDLVVGFASTDRGALVAPPLPGAEATDEELREFIRKSSSIATHYLEINGLSLPKGALVIFDPESLTLAARLPRIAQSSVAFTADAFSSEAPRYLSFDQTIIEAPVADLRKAIAEAGKRADHTDLLEELERGVADGRGRIVAFGSLESRSGQRASVEGVANTGIPVDITIDDEDRVEFVTEVQPVGLDWPIDAQIGPDGDIIDVNIAVTYHFSPPEKRVEAITRRGATTVSSTVIDTHIARVISSYTLRSGATKLLGVWTPEGVEGKPKAEVLQAAFLSGDVVTVLPLPNENLAGMLRDHGDAVAPIPEGDPEFEQIAEEIPEGMVVRRFRVPPTFLSSAGGAGGASVDDPFAAAAGTLPMEPRFTIQATAKDILMAAGVPFPPGTSANYIRSTSTLVVRNTPENMHLVEALIMSISAESPKSIGLAAYIVEAPAEWMRSLARETRTLANHESAWKEIESNEEARVLSSHWIETRSGQRAKVEAGRDYIFNVGADFRSGRVSSGPDESENDGSPSARATASVDPGVRELTPYQETEHVGTQFEVDPMVGPDGITVDLNFVINRDYAPPAPSLGDSKKSKGGVTVDVPTTTFYEAKVTSSVTMRSGMIRMVGLWQPEGADGADQSETLQGVFIRANVIRLDEEE
ncbi:MAG: hypothetical protein AAF591_14705 [Verrucomicrobiota bacterium]